MKRLNIGHPALILWSYDDLYFTGLTTISNTIENFDEEGWEQKDREINSEWEAKAAAYRIFKNVAKPDHK